MEVGVGEPGTNTTSDLFCPGSGSIRKNRGPRETQKRFFCAGHPPGGGGEQDGRGHRRVRDATSFLQSGSVSTRRTSLNAQEQLQGPGRSAHTAGCEHNCPIWHTETRGRVTEASPRITQLATPRTLHPHFQWNQDVSAFPPPSSSSHSAVPGVSSVSSGQLVVTRVSHAARTARLTPRLEQLSEPRTRDGGMFFERGRPEQPIRPVGPFRLGPHVPEARRALMSPSSTFAGFPSGEDRQSVPARQQPVLTQAAHEGLRPQPGAGRVHSGTPAASIMEVNAPLLLLFS
ncbi:ADP-ribosylation factor-like protein 9 isoform X9 [Denticeps clupeoides]|uniref:ADP-ribosylation factor-like protein 9 isoform X9 n=1 Tax=Denticeps clupeoides TaxID=299321 RepID=UPI0010A390A8|nr:ADP-ribosylation factor-like protein 9 isoform X9 [Denticeps clupeoides]